MTSTVGEDAQPSDEQTLAGAPVSVDDPTLLGDGSFEESSADRARTELLGPGQGPRRLSRYLLLDKLGEGGMGRVYSAYDETLDRKVAIKLLRNEGHPEAQRRLLREAQAMARLSHPNVIQVYEIGETDETDELGEREGPRAFIVMEFIDGQTLGAWRRAESRTRAELLAVFIAAGRGLAAAHAQGLVHRDFKPDNVMVRRDGRVVVMDFGLAREGGAAEEGEHAIDEREASIARARAPELGVDMTATGALMGTPAYMSPEQFHGEVSDAKTDQFSFCVALWEALVGERPFRAPNVPGLSLAVTTGELRRPESTDVPSWLLGVVERGLAVAPGERWPSMDALIAALASDPTARRRWILAGLGVAALTVGLVFGAGLLDAWAEDRERAACAREAQAIVEVWNPEVRAQLDARFADAKTLASWERAAAWMDDYTAAWSRLRERSCVAATVEGTRSPAEHDRVAACLDEARGASAAVVEVWGTPEAKIVAHTVTSATGLAPVELCNRPAWLAQRVAPPDDPAVHAEVERLRAQLQRVEALALVADLEAAHRRAARVLAAAKALGWVPLIAEARLVCGELEAELGRLTDARETLTEAGLEAFGVGHDLVTLRASIALATLAGYRLSEPTAGHYWARLGRELLQRMGLEGTSDEAELLHSLADVQWTAGDYPEALETYQRAHALAVTTLGPEHPRANAMLADVGYLRMELADYTQAMADFGRARAASRAALGPKHPDVGRILEFESTTLALMGDHERALDRAAEAMAVYEAALGTSHPSYASAMSKYGGVLSKLGRNAEAIERYTEALAIQERVYGGDSTTVAALHNNIAIAEIKMGHDSEAREAFVRARDVWIGAYGADHPHVAIARSNIASIQLRGDEFEAAKREFEAARAILFAAHGPGHPRVVRLDLYIGECLLGLGRKDEARAIFTASVEALEDVETPERSRAQFALAKVLTDSERERALELAKLARAANLGRGEAGRDMVEAIDAWLASVE